jgi:HK97 family phage prohead protease
LTPADLTARAQKGDEPNGIFFDKDGKRIAKAIGLSGSIEEPSTAAAERAITFVISTGGLDRYNSTIAVKGWKIDAFNKNPVCLWGHDDSIPCIARAETTRVDGGRLVSTAVFATREIHPLADTIYQLIKAKFINAASVGWIPLKWQFVDEEGRGFGIDYLEQELLEFSVVNIPANPECLVEARSLGIDLKPLMMWAERTLDLGGMTAVARGELERLRRAADSATSAGYRAPDRALKLFTRAIEDLGLVTNAGKVLSAANKKKLEACADHLKSAGDHCTAAADHVRSVMESCRDADDDDGDGDAGDAGDEAAAAAATRQRRARALRLFGGPAA